MPRAQLTHTKMFLGTLSAQHVRPTRILLLRVLLLVPAPATLATPVLVVGPVRRVHLELTRRSRELQHARPVLRTRNLLSRASLTRPVVLILATRVPMECLPLSARWASTRKRSGVSRAPTAQQTPCRHWVARCQLPVCQLRDTQVLQAAPGLHARLEHTSRR